MVGNRCKIVQQMLVNNAAYETSLSRGERVARHYERIFPKDLVNPSSGLNSSKATVKVNVQSELIRLTKSRYPAEGELARNGASWIR